MAEADGKIIIDTELDDKNVVKGIQKMSSKSKKLMNDIRQTENQINSLAEALKKMSATRLNQKEFDQMKTKVKMAEEELAALYEKAKQREKDIEIPGLSEDEMFKVYEQDKTWQELARDIEAAEQKLDEYEKKLAILKSNDATQADTLEYRIKTDKLDAAKLKLEELEKKQRELPTSSERISKIFDQIGKKVSKGAKTCLSFLGKIRKTGVGTFKAITGGMDKSKKSTDRMNGGLLQSAKFMAKMAGTALFFQGFSKVTAAIGDTISELTLKDKVFAKSLAQVKANLATSFTPIWNAALPGLKEMAKWLSFATAKLGGFLSALTGANATSIKGSVGETADEMNKLAEETEKANHQLNSYDKLNVRSKKDKDKDEDTSTEGVTASGVTMGNWDGLVKRLKDSWKRQDFSWLGKILAQKINKSMQNIPWKNIRKNAKRIAKCIGTFFNGFIGKLNWKLLGKTMAKGLNTAILFLNTLLTTLKWGKLGKGIAKAMNGFLRTTDWKGAGRVIRNCLNAVFSLAYTWSKGFNFKLLGKSVAKSVNSAISKIQWKNALTAATNLGKGIADAANSFIHKTDFEKLGKTVADFIKTGVNGWYANVTTFNFKELGTKIGDSINGFLKEMNTVDDKTGLSGWQKLGKSITAQLAGIIDAITYALDRINWKEVGTSIGTFLAELDWLELLGKVAKAIWTALGGALQAWKSWFDSDSISAAIVAALIVCFSIDKLSFLLQPLTRNIGIILSTAIRNSKIVGAASTLAKTFGSTFVKVIGQTKIAQAIVHAVSFATTKISALATKISTALFTKLQTLFSSTAFVGKFALGAALVAVIAAEVYVLIDKLKDLIDAYYQTDLKTYTTTLTQKQLDSIEAKLKTLKQATSDTKNVLSNFKTKMSEATTVSNTDIEKLADSYYKLSQKANPTATELAVMKKYSKELSAILPGFSKNVDKQTGAFTGNKSVLDGLVGSYKRALKAQVAYEQSVELYQQREKNKQELKKAKKTEKEAEKNFKDAQKHLAELKKQGFTIDDYVYKNALKQVGDLAGIYNEARFSTKELEKKQKELNSQIKKNNNIMRNAKISTKEYNATTEKLEKTFNKLGIKGKSQGEIIKTLKKAVDDGEISWKDYKKLVDGNYKSAKDLQDAINKLSPKSVKIEAKVSGKKDVDDTKNAVNGLLRRMPQQQKMKSTKYQTARRFL